MSTKQKRFILPEDEIPRFWYNIQADMKNKPMTDLYVPFVLVVTQDGKLSISLDEDMGEMTFLEDEKE